jgi:OOP family OmpA-OmpF porin
MQDLPPCGQEVAFNLRDIHMKKFLFAAALSAACGLASAQGYAGALIGLAKINSDCTAGATCDDNSTGMKVYGGYEVAPNISVEVGYTGFGKASAKGNLGSAEIKTTALVLNGAFRFPIAADFTGVGRLGLASVKGKYTTNVPGVKNTSKSAIKLYTGLGLEYDIAKDVKLVGAFDLTNSEVEVKGSSDSGAVFLFGAGVQAAF